jgi:hypothetical protein
MAQCPWQVSQLLLILSARVSDLHHFSADPDLSLHFNVDPDPTFYLNADPDPVSTGLQTLLAPF